MNNTTKSLIIPETHFSRTFNHYLWFIKDDAIYCITTHGVEIQLFQPLLNQEEIVQQHNINLLLGITDEQYNQAIMENFS